MLEMEKLRYSRDFSRRGFLCILVCCCGPFLSSKSGDQSPNVLNDTLSDGGVLSMGVVENSRIYEARAATYAAAPVSPNVLNDSLPAGDVLSMVLVSNFKMNKAQSAADSAAQVTSNLINDVLPSGGCLSMGDV